MRICKVTKNMVIITRIYNHFLLKKIISAHKKMLQALIIIH